MTDDVILGDEHFFVGQRFGVYVRNVPGVPWMLHSTTDVIRDREHFFSLEFPFKFFVFMPVGDGPPPIDFTMEKAEEVT